MQVIMRIIYGAMAIALMVSCSEKEPVKQADSAMPFASFKEIPGITSDEIKAIEAFQKKNLPLKYGVIPTTEAFIKNDGSIGGFSALYCEWLSALFGIRFEPVLAEFRDVLEKAQNMEIDFAYDMRAASKRYNNYFATNPIALRSIKAIRLEGSLHLANIALQRPLRYAFLEGSIVIEDVASVAEPGSYKAVQVSNLDTVYQFLKRGEIDAFIALNSVEAAFDKYYDISVEDFLPIIFSPVSMITRNPELEPFISVLNKALENGVYPYLAEMYANGYMEYKKHKLFMCFTEEELAYIHNAPVILFAAEHNDYPHEFYNTHIKQWQGISFDLLNEISKLTGLSFKLFNNQQAKWDDLVKMLSDKEVSMLVDMVRTKERDKHFIWTETDVFEDNYAIISKVDSRKISINDIIYLKVGLVKGWAMEELFREWFPYHKTIISYDNYEALEKALERGEVDITIINRNRFLAMANYYENPNFKIDVVFEPQYYSGFAFNKDEAILRSIIDKTFKFVDIKNITTYWKTKTFYYKTELMEKQRPWFIGVIIFTIAILGFIFVFFMKNRKAKKWLENIVKFRTNELELQASTLQTMIDSVPCFVFCKDLNFNYTLGNKQMLEYFGIEKERIIGKNTADALVLPAELIEKINETEQDIINNGQRIVYEILLPSLDGTERLFESIKVPLVINNAIAGVIGILYDITKRKEMEEGIRMASRSKTTFLANISHEMRTPMNVVVGLTSLMLEEDNPAINLRNNLRKINTAGNTLLGLINDVLDISKIEAGKLELAPVQYQVPSILNDVVILNVIRIEEKPIEFKLDINRDLPYSLFGDDLRVKQIINNLLSNAFKYTQSGTVTLGVNCERNGQDVWMSVYVSDTGIGIREDDQKKLFTDYSQVDIRTNRAITGTGLGLSIAKMLVKHMNGEISVESEYGKGSTFRFRIKQGYISNNCIGTEIAENLREFRYMDDKKKVNEKFARPDLSYASVLIVDDMQTNLMVAAGMLKKYKMHVDCVDSGHEAIELIKSGKHAYDAIFMDHMMPGMDGVEAAEKIRAIGTKYAMTVPIIALTANAVAGNEQMFISKDFQAFLAKPINIVNLDSVVQRWIRDKSKE